MKRKIVWLLLSCLMALSLVLASCAPAVEEKEVVEKEKEVVVKEKEVVEKEKEAVKEKEVVAAADEGPRYGGVIVFARSTDPLNFDETNYYSSSAPAQVITSDTLFLGDYAAGPGGSQIVMWNYNILPPFESWTPGVAESWEFTDDRTLVYKIRQGTHFGFNPDSEASRLVNGREVTADDVAFTLKRKWTTTTSYVFSAYPWKKNFEVKDGGPWIEATDEWTVVLHLLPGDMQLEEILFYTAMYTMIVPPEVVAKYGSLKDWRNSVGSGPFMLTDFVSGSSMTFIRNPNYWMKDPANPENRLPYVDGVKMLNIGDLSTRLAALRTGKIDQLILLPREDAGIVMKTNPELEVLPVPSAAGDSVFMRIDRPELPFADIRVRRALAMAIDNQEILDAYFGGQGEILHYPIMPFDKLIYIPLEELSESIREQFEYHPDKARELLAEAGYPDGFETSVLIGPDQADMMSIYADYFARIGVTLNLDVREQNVATTVGYDHAHEAMVWRGTHAAKPYTLVEVYPGNFTNLSMVDDPVINEASIAIKAAFPDSDKQQQLIKELTPYILEQAYWLQVPVGNTYNFWQPWLKNYTGEHYVGALAGMYGWTRYVWIDQDLKEEKTGSR